MNKKISLITSKDDTDTVSSYSNENENESDIDDTDSTIITRPLESINCDESVICWSHTKK